MAGAEKSTLILGQLNIIVKVCLSKKTANSHFQYVRVHVTHIDIYIYVYLYHLYIIYIYVYLYIHMCLFPWLVSSNFCYINCQSLLFLPNNLCYEILKKSKQTSIFYLIVLTHVKKDITRLQLYRYLKICHPSNQNHQNFYSNIIHHSDSNSGNKLDRQFPTIKTKVLTPLLYNMNMTNNYEYKHKHKILIFIKYIWNLGDCKEYSKI